LPKPCPSNAARAAARPAAHRSPQHKGPQHQSSTWHAKHLAAAAPSAPACEWVDLTCHTLKLLLEQEFGWVKPLSRQGQS